MRTGLLREEWIDARFWTTGEERVIRRYYPAGRANACLPYMPTRSPQAIRQHAYAMRRAGRL